MLKQGFLLLLMLVALSSAAYAAEGRQVLPLNADWRFEGQAIDGSRISETVTLPHTWNARDSQQGFSYYRGKGRYTRNLPREALPEGKRIFVRFEGAGTVAELQVNGKLAGRHRGGYSAFVFEITHLIKPGAENQLAVQVDNSFQNDVLPIGGDFNIYGGLHRPAQLIVTDPLCISPLDYASSGVYLRQLQVTREAAEIEVITVLSNGTGKPQNATVHMTLVDAEGRIVLEQSDPQQLAAAGPVNVSQPVTLPHPHLWAGRDDPYLYRVEVRLESGGRILDEVHQPLGLRSYRVDPKQGFLLNGLPMRLQGVSRHQDWQDQGSALSTAAQDRDMELILELGANAVRLAGYQHPDYFYGLCDRAGLVAWAEIPLVGGLVSGFNDTTAFRDNGKQQLIELIRQNYNHPSILFWGLFSELSPGNGNKNPENFVHQLQVLAKKEDPDRLTTAASFLDGGDPLNSIPDTIAFNRYFGWYYDNPRAIAGWADQTRSLVRQQSFAISEYGAGGSADQHEQNPRRPIPMFHPWHPEEYQNLVHEGCWPEIEKRSFIWGSFAWNMFDFGSSFRREGPVAALNDKGLVTYDRALKKDAFYFYKASWSQEPVLHITSRRQVIRENPVTEIKAYSNLDEVELLINGRSSGKAAASGPVFRWPNQTLRKGNNIIQVIGRKAGRQHRDSCVWVFDGVPLVDLLVPFVRWWVKPVYLLSVLCAAALYLLGYKRIRSGWLRSSCRILFYFSLAWLAVLIGLYFVGRYYGISVFEFSQF